MNETVLVILFVLGYAAIALEHLLGVNKAAIALLMAVGCWALSVIGAPSHEEILQHLAEHLAEIAQIVLFLLGAMAIVELLNSYHAFDVLQRRIARGGVRAVLWGLPACAFFLSALLDNVTTTILMISILRPLVPAGENRWTLAGLIVIAANAGGAWSPIGDVTTTMLWIGERVTSAELVTHLFVPSLVCLVVPLAIVIPRLARTMAGDDFVPEHAKAIPWSGRLLILGIGSLLLVPVLKTSIGLPPYLGVLFGLGLLWTVTDLIGPRADRTVPRALARIDISSVLFFLGILLAVASLQTAGTLAATARGLDATIGNTTIILSIFGLLSAIVDNVPLTAAVMGMYDEAHFPADAELWHLTAFCVGTGGSILIIGSAAGVVAMGMEKIRFGWYLRRIGTLALAGYAAGIGCYLLLNGAP